MADIEEDVIETEDNPEYMDLYQGDDTDAFGSGFIEIDIDNETGEEPTKAIWQCGSVVKVIDKPVFPYMLQLNREETRKLKGVNTCYLAVFDKDGKKRTCIGSLTFNTKEEIVSDGRCGC